MKVKAGDVFLYNSADEPAWDAWRRPVQIPAGRHTFVKQKDTFMDKLFFRSWYLVDNIMLIYVEAGGYVEERCLEKVLVEETDRNRMIHHIKVWNRWRKRSLNSKMYKFLVLIGLAKSPTLESMK